MSIRSQNRWHYRSDLARRRLLSSRLAERVIGRLYFLLFWHRQASTWRNTRWLGVEVFKLPLDLWVYQELLDEVRPDLIIETGTAGGGSAYFFASVLDLLGHGRVVTLDIDDYPGRPEHPRIEYVRGSSIDPEVLASVAVAIGPDDVVMVVLDADHSAAHVRQEIRQLAPLVTPGSYLVVEDGAVRWHPVRGADGKVVGWDRGPGAAVKEFLRSAGDFQADRTREKYFATQNPGSWLRRTERSEPRSSQ